MIDTQAIRERNLAAVVDGDAQEFVQRIAEISRNMQQTATVTNCLANGYAPKGYGLADFSIVQKDGLFHLFHIPRVPGNNCTEPANEHWLGHAVSEDLDTWITCNPALCANSKNDFEAGHVWAPFVFQDAEQTLMFYTGLSMHLSQVICVARSTDKDLNVWQRDENNPIIPQTGFDWHWTNDRGHVRHGRDPHVVKVEGGYLLTYTAWHRNTCPAVGGLFSSDLKHWQDLGPILYRPMTERAWWPESVNIQQLDNGKWVLIPSMSPGLEYYLSDDPLSWHQAKPTFIEYNDGPRNEPMAIEVVSRKIPDRWLVTFFEQKCNRLFVGQLNLSQNPWTLSRLRTKDALQSWLG